MDSYTVTVVIFSLERFHHQMFAIRVGATDLEREGQHSPRFQRID
jgi:hypothetical protein